MGVMSPDQEASLSSRFPFLHGLEYGMECGNGWFGIIERLCQAIQELPPPEGFAVVQVKQKFAGLRFYYDPFSEEVDELVKVAEDESFKTCEVCGSTDGVSQFARRGWLFTRCDACRREGSDHAD